MSRTITTAGDLIAFSLRTAGVNGVGQTPVAEDFNDMLVLLRSMVAEWQRKRWLVPNLIDMSIMSTGAEYYTIGPQRPDRIYSAYVRLLGSVPSVDIPLALIGTYEKYAAITLKQLSTFPAAVFYDVRWPIGRVYFWPIPAASQYEMHILTRDALPQFATLTEEITLPPEYMSALIYSLAVRALMQYNMPVRPDLVAAMRESLGTIRTANFQVPTASMPAGMGGQRGSGVAAGADPHFQSGIW